MQGVQGERLGVNIGPVVRDTEIKVVGDRVFVVLVLFHQRIRERFAVQKERRLTHYGGVSGHHVETQRGVHTFLCTYGPLIVLGSAPNEGDVPVRRQGLGGEQLVPEEPVKYFNFGFRFEVDFQRSITRGERGVFLNDVN